ncbi:hypothetical protein DOM21_14255 [Bacteriovorax stolpii]|uniref:hypothetical protein n=1 Tax=Bacteriovorax stolpii TaxID=960 RepID=UPI0011573614|nr:hypothetical protein [Bacteriovorax stolpii]QDK42592.1 hypothetical protein DOM21_14255 [Bacteriovorax stolpii]
MTQVKLSFQDTFLLAFEREDLPFNSFFYFESETAFDLKKIRQTFIKQVELEPQLNLICSYETGKCTYRKFSNSEIANAITTLMTDKHEETFLASHFDETSPPVKLGLMNKNGKHLLIFSFHHPLFDGHAQMNYLQDFFTIYRGEDYTPRSLSDVVHFRSYFLKTSPLWYLKQLFGLFKREKKEPILISRFFDHETTSRVMSYSLLEYDKKSIDQSVRKTKLSPTTFFSFCALRAFDRIQKERGDNQNPVVIYIPKSMRFEMKKMRAFQNLVGFIWMKFKREKITNEQALEHFRDFYKYRSGGDEIRKVLFFAGLITKFTSYQKLRFLLEKKEKKVHDCSILISSGRTPKEVVFPDEFKNAKFYARGTMYRSPGIGILVTSNENRDFVCVEYLKGAFKKESIERFCQILDEEIKSHRSDS